MIQTKRALIAYNLSDAEFARIRRLIYTQVGIHLADSKKMLVISRLSRRLRDLELDNFTEYCRYVEDGDPQEIVRLVNLITTNMTNFFRESHHFDFLLQRYLPGFFASGPRKLRIWSAGCSSGEEPYTIAVCVEEFLRANPLPGSDIKILATDVDTDILEKARNGVYRKESLAAVPKTLSARYFSERDGRTMQVSEEIRRKIVFRRFNLTHEFPFHHGFDLIFCRNVLIYFTQDDRLRIVKRFHGSLREDGHLLLGHSESLLADQCGFRNMGNTVYVKLPVLT